MTQMPLNFPIGLCLPKECNTEDYFRPTLKTIQAMTNQGLTYVKQYVNLDNSYNTLPKLIAKNGYDLALVKQLSAIVFNGT